MAVGRMCTGGIPLLEAERTVRLGAHPDLGKRLVTLLVERRPNVDVELVQPSSSCTTKKPSEPSGW